MNTFYWTVVIVMLLSAVGCSGATATSSVPLTATQNEVPMAISEIAAAKCESINVLYHERPPYMTTVEQGVDGLTGTPTRLVFEKAGIPYQWVLTPSKRAVVIIQENTGCDCGVGWFKNPAREEFAKFTLPLYQDKPQIAIGMVDNPNLQDDLTVEQLLSNKKLILSVKDGYSYGMFLDEKISQYTPTIEVTTAENINMLNMVYKKRIDYFFMAPEEADGLIADSGLPKDAFQYIHLTDIPDGEKRYLMCSKNVSDVLIEKINTAIQEVIK